MLYPSHNSCILISLQVTVDRLRLIQRPSKSQNELPMIRGPGLPKHSDSLVKAEHSRGRQLLPNPTCSPQQPSELCIPVAKESSHKLTKFSIDQIPTSEIHGIKIFFSLNALLHRLRVCALNPIKPWICCCSWLAWGPWSYILTAFEHANTCFPDAA
jgi:hypothetical protein